MEKSWKNKILKSFAQRNIFCVKKIPQKKLFGKKFAKTNFLKTNSRKFFFVRQVYFVTKIDITFFPKK